MKATIKPIMLVALFLTVTMCLCATPIALQALGTATPLSANKAYAATDELAAGSLDAQATDGTTLDTQAASNNTADKPTKKARKTFKAAAADFSLKLFQQCVAAKNDSSNVTVSPLSVMNALAVTANGAAGETSAQMRDVLAGGMSMKQLNKTLSWYNSKLSNTKKARLKSANSIWYHNDGSLKVSESFLSKNKKFYDAEVVPADFSNHQTVDDINGWVADKTNNMIKRVISDLKPDDRLAIINALYFDAKWSVPFEKNAVYDAEFTTASGSKKTVEMMHGDEGRYIEGEGVCGFVKPYAKGYSYVALLPDEGTSLKDFVASLDGATFSNLVSSATPQNVRIALPKYSLSYSNEEMAQQLVDMGMTNAFNSGIADFSKMGESSRGNLFLGEVIHKTKIDVDEAGTKAAAVTAVIVKDSAAFIDDIKFVSLDRPFVYAIVDNTMNLPVFIGAVNTIGE